MNNLITNPQGLDYEIQFAQKELYEGLLSKWNGYKIDGYGLSYLRHEKDQTHPEAFLKKNDYGLNLINKESKFFFVKNSENIPVDDGFKTKVDIYFILNLKKIYPNIEHRATQEVQIDVLDILEDCSIDKVIKVVDTLQEFLRDFRGMYNRMLTLDRQPNHVFKIETEMYFNLNKKCNE